MRVALVAMPFASVERPSIQIGLLKAIADRRGHEAHTFHLNIDFVSRLDDYLDEDGATWYRGMTEERSVIGDWLFSGAAFGDDAPDPAAMIDYVGQSNELTEMLEVGLRELYHDVVPSYIQHCLDSVDWASFDVVGFTSTFQQNAASFALARRIKEHFPDITILFGGANFDGDMGVEWVRSMPFIDFAIRGEADESFPAFLDALANGQDPLFVPGVVGRRGDNVVATDSDPIEQLDKSPVPAYDEFFERVTQLGAAHRMRLVLPYESARGCWWGAKRHCTFCGLNGQTMSFRAKSQKRVLEELVDMALRYRVLNFFAVDNIIDMAYFDSLLPELARKGRPFRLFYEAKADLDRAQLELMVQAGIDHIQPGIESLSSRVLGLMRKGTRAAWNVNLLRWGQYYGMGIYWNLLWGFPGETEEDTATQLELLPRLRHLIPPGGAGRVWMERFSPMFTETDRFTTNRLEPSAEYRLVYPDQVDLEQAAYFFDYGLDDTLPDEHYDAITEYVMTWISEVDGGDERSLTVDDRGDHLHFVDGRAGGEPITVELRGDAMTVHRAIHDHWALRRELAERLDMSDDRLATALGELDDQGLIFPDGQLVSALALPIEPPPLTAREGAVWRRPASELNPAEAAARVAAQRVAEAQMAEAHGTTSVAAAAR